ncbi:MAG: hypothetical protein KBH45_17940 [Verrucomicrobia bacterium]|nr:hypothetical protein [Verrucomicrobiota bacterium]
MKPSEKHQAQTVGWNAKPAWIKQGGIPFSCRQHPEWGVRRNSGRRWPGLGAWLIVAGLLLPVAHPVPVTASPIVRAVGPQLQVGVDRTTGQIVELIDRSSQHNLAGLSTNRGGLWELEFADGGKLTPANARVCEATPLAGKPGGLHLEWRELGRGGAPELRVEVEVRLDPDQAVSHWQIALHNLQGQSPHLIRFPRLLEVPEQPGERLAVPVWLGQQAEHPRTLLNGPAGKSRRLEWSYPGLLSLQCVALTGGGGTGLYAACDDTAGYLKDFAVFGNGSAGFNLEILHRPENNDPARKTYALPYAVGLGAFHGNWFDAATRYRSWATNQSWARESRLKLGLGPSWVTNTALWVWNRGASPGVLDPAIALQKELGLPVSVFWHWWHGCAYDAGFPEYLPPREGEAPFQAALQRAHANDVRAIVYMNQRLWGMTTASWTNENAARFAVKAADGEVRPEVYNTFTKSPCASMCMGTEFWRHKYAGLAASAFGQLGVDGIYMDQACSSLACFDPQHGHAIGGGTYWMGGFQSLAAEIRQRCAERGRPALAGEGCGENWLPYLDLMLSLQVSHERYAGPDGWETIPFFHAVYHGYSVFYGNYSSLTMPPYDELWPVATAPREPLKLLDRKFARQFRLEQARAFVWGQQPTIANFRPTQLQERAEELDYVVRLARIHARARSYLLHGEMLAPPEVEVPTAELEMSRLSIYAGQQGGLKEFRQRSPLVLATGWRAPNQTVAIAVASISDQPVNPQLRVDAAAYGLPERGQVYRIDAAGRKRMGDFHGKTLILQPELAPLDACLLELKPD